MVLFKLACSGPRAICGQSESRPKVPVQLAKLSAMMRLIRKAGVN